MRNTLFLIAFFLLVACNDDPVQCVKFSELKPGEKMEITFLTSEKETGEAREKEILKKLSDELSSNKKIIAVKTVYKNSFLFSVEVIYVFVKESSKIKMKYLTSSAKHFPEREREVRSLLEEVLKETIDILIIQSVYKHGYLIAAEIYYQ